MTEIRFSLCPYKVLFHPEIYDLVCCRCIYLYYDAFLMLKLINTERLSWIFFYGMSGGGTVGIEYSFYMSDTWHVSKTVGTLKHQDKSNFAKFSFCRIRLNSSIFLFLFLSLILVCSVFLFFIFLSVIQ